MAGKRKIALVTGITGQDGAYLASFLLEKGYEVHGIKRRSSMLNTQRVDHLYQEPHEEHLNFKLHYGDLTDAANLISIVQETQPDEIYNLGAMSHVKVSFECPEYAANTDALGTLRLLEAIRLLGRVEKTKFYQASTSEMFGLVQQVPQTESTPFYPRSPYAAAKVYAYWMTINYREAYNMFACNGILFNHESPLRGETFVTRKITRAVARIGLGLQQKLFLGNLNASRDWGHARDYVEAMWAMLQHERPDDYVIATGVTTTVRQFTQLAFRQIGVTLRFEGTGVKEVGIVASSDNADFYLMPGTVVVETDPRYFRPTEVDLLIGDPSKAKQILGWSATTTVEALAQEMVESDIRLFMRDKILQSSGYDVLSYED